MSEGAKGFGEAFWQRNYDRPDQMDGVFNAAAHADHLASSFAIHEQRVASVADFGFGQGQLFAAVLARLTPYKAYGLEPSAPAFALAEPRLRAASPRTKLLLEPTDLASWCRHPDHPKRRFDLGLCTSVLQYLQVPELELALVTLARRVKWLYLTVPTSDELARLARDSDFTDPWATPRDRAAWRDLLHPHFEAVDGRLLESRTLVDPQTSPFTDDLHRGW